MADMTRRARAAAAPLLAALLLAGCGSVPEYPLVAPTGTVAESGGAWSRWLEVEVSSVRDQAVTILGARIASPLFTGIASVRVDQELAPDGTVTLRLPIGVAECPPGLGESSVQVSLEADGVELLQTVMVPEETLVELNARQCESQTAGDAVAPSFGTVAASEDGVVATELVLVRGDSMEPVEVLEVTGSRVFDVSVDEGALPLTMTSAQVRTAVPVAIRPAACEPLSPLDAAGVLTFTVTVRVGGGGEQAMTVTPQGSVRSELEAMLEACDG